PVTVMVVPAGTSASTAKAVSWGRKTGRFHNGSSGPASTAPPMRPSHAPEEQVAPMFGDMSGNDRFGQTFPHAPQLFGSVVSSTHVPLHSVSEGKQTHEAPLHCRFSEHATPHAPQLRSSADIVVHVPLQFVSSA